MSYHEHVTFAILFYECLVKMMLSRLHRRRLHCTAIVNTAAILVQIYSRPNHVHAEAVRAVWQVWLDQFPVNDAARVNTELIPHFCVNRISVTVSAHYKRFCY